MTTSTAGVHAPQPPHSQLPKAPSSQLQPPQPFPCLSGLLHRPPSFTFPPHRPKNNTRPSGFHTQHGIFIPSPITAGAQPRTPPSHRHHMQRHRANQINCPFSLHPALHQSQNTLFSPTSSYLDRDPTATKLTSLTLNSQRKTPQISFSETRITRIS